MQHNIIWNQILDDFNFNFELTMQVYMQISYVGGEGK